MKTLLEISKGAAHEINHPLTAILGYTEISLAQFEEGHAVHPHQKHIDEVALRITEIVKRMQAVREYRTRPCANGQRIADFGPEGKTKSPKALSLRAPSKSTTLVHRSRLIRLAA